MSLASNNEKATAKKEIVKSIRDLASLKLTLPLGNPNLKLVHTNQFLFTELPTDTFLLANMDSIATAMNSSYSRYSGYQANRWYIESVTINNDGNNAKMELELNPFASALLNYKDNRHGLEEAYTNAMNQNKNTTSSSNKNVASTKKKKKSIKQAVKEVGKLTEGKKYSHAYQSASAFRKYGKGDCWACSYFIACELKKRGVTAKIIQYPTSMSQRHRSVLYKNDDGKWVNFPYRSYKIHSWFRNTRSTGTKITINCG